METDNELVVIAQNPAEMQAAQTQLTAWAGRKCAEAEAERLDLATNLAIAKKNKWNTKTLERALDRAEKRLSFQQKVEAALSNGFCIIPNFPVDIFAIRTTAKNPRENVTTNWGGTIDQATTSPELGEGRYVNTRPTERTREWKEKNADGREVTLHNARAVAFQDVDFPFAVAKTRVVEATSRAMALNIFDEVGILPFRPGHHAGDARLMNADPMVIGKIKMRRNAYAFREISFLVTWFIDTKTL